MEAPTKWWNFKFSGRVEITPENLQIGTAFYGSYTSESSLSVIGQWAMLHCFFSQTVSL